MAVSDREFGELLGDVKAMKKDLSELETTAKGLNEKVDGILSKFDQATGGLRVAMAVSGFLGALAMLLLTKVLPILFAGLPKL